MRKFLVVTIPIATLVLFICIMLSGGFLKKPFGTNDDVEKTIKMLIEDVNNEAWDEVREEVADLDQGWKKVMVRIQFSQERDEINSLTTNIARLRGAVSAEDKAGSLIELNDAYSHWKELGR